MGNRRSTAAPSPGVAEACPTPRAAPVGVGSGYKPALDGVRAVAVAMVIAFHLSREFDLDVLGAGWLGVDVFFVLSGYLITSLLLAEERRHGRIALGRFYARRFLRLAPLSIVAVAVVGAVTAAGLSDSVGLDITWAGAISILFYFSNWMPPDSLGSLLHAWSLSIEEQFYLVWPGVLVVIVVAARRRARWMLAAVLLTGVTAMGLARRHLWSSAQGDPAAQLRAFSEFYRGTFLRPDGLLYGCLLAVVLHRVRVTTKLRRLCGAGALVGAVVVVGVYLAVSPDDVGLVQEWGLSAFDIGVTAIIGWLVLVPGSWGARMLSLRGFTWVGRRAYGIYLLHPLVHDVFVTTTRLDGWFLGATVVVCSLAVSAASFRWLETPFLRLKGRFASDR